MRWEDESYVRWYRRNTPEWCLMSWQARGLFGLIMREVDRAGILELGKLGLKAVAVVVRAHWDEIEQPLAELVEDGCIVFRNDLRILLVPNFIEAQEANASDKARQRGARERARDVARAKSLLVTPESRNVTEGSQIVPERHAHAVNGHSVLSVPSVLSPPQPPGGARTADETSPEAQRSDPPEPPKAETPFDVARRIYAEYFRKRHGREFTLTSFGHNGSDEWAFVNIGRLAAAKGDAERWLRHWMRAYLKDDEKWLVDNAHPPRHMEKRLNKYGEPKRPRPPEPAKVEHVEPPRPARSFVPLKPIATPQIRAASTPAELAEKARTDKARLAAFEKSKS